MKKKLILGICLILVLSFTLAACGGGSGSGDGDKNAAVSINSPEDFPGHSIAVQTATTAADSVNELNADGKIDVHEYESVTQCFDDLSLGRADAVYVDSVVSSYYTTGKDEYKRSWLSEIPEPMAICLAKGNDKLTAAVEAAIDTMYFDGTMADIAKKNFGDDFTAGLRDVKEAPVIPTDFTTAAKGILSVGMEATYPPMEYTSDDGKDFIGFDVDVSNRIAELLGLKVEFVNTSWDGIFAGLDKGQYDIIASAVSINDEREEKFSLTKPYVANALCIVVRND
jgi:ABC-type amino acid transport substrate-binding protein